MALRRGPGEHTAIVLMLLMVVMAAITVVVMPMILLYPSRVAGPEHWVMAVRGYQGDLAIGAGYEG